MEILAIDFENMELVSKETCRIDNSGKRKDGDFDGQFEILDLACKGGWVEILRKMKRVLPIKF